MTYSAKKRKIFCMKRKAAYQHPASEYSSLLIPHYWAIKASTSFDQDWLVRAWVRIPFATIFSGIPRADDSLCLSVFSFQFNSKKRKIKHWRIWWWWCYPTPSDGWGCGGAPRRPSSPATPQGLDQWSKMEEVVPKMVRRRGSDAGQSRKR